MKNNYFDSIFNNPLRNISNVLRYNGMFSLKPESVPNHGADMFAMAYSMTEILYEKHNDECVRLGLSIKELAYKIMIHDIDEAILCDVPRSLKYLTPEVTKSIKAAVRELMMRKFKKHFVEDIDLSKGYHDLNSILVKLCDVMQARFKIYEEFHLLGNKSYEPQMKTSKDYLDELALEIMDDHSVGGLSPSIRVTLRDMIIECVNNTTGESKPLVNNMAIQGAYSDELFKVMSNFFNSATEEDVELFNEFLIKNKSNGIDYEDHNE